MSIVKVRPIPLPVTVKLMGYEAAGYTRAPNTKEYILALPDSKTGRLCTGLEFEIDNSNYKSEEETPGVPKKILKRHELEQRMGVDNLSTNSDFWETKRVGLKDGDNFFNTDIPEEDLELCMLKASSKVCPSLTERNKYPFAKYVIYDEETEQEIKEKKNSLKVEASDIFKELSPADRRKFTKIIGRLVGDAKDSTVYNTLFEYMEENPKAFIELTKKPKDKINIEAEIRDALEVNALRRKDGRIFRVVGDDPNGKQIGFDIQDAVDFLSKAENQDIRVQLKAEIKAKKGRVSE